LHGLPRPCITWVMTGTRPAITSDVRPARAFLTCAMLLAAFLALAAPEAADMARQWTWSSSYHHGWLAAPIACWLFIDGRAWRTAKAGTDLLGLAPLSLAVALLLAGRIAEAALLGHIAIVAGIIGACLLTLGRAVIVKSAFAFGFLIFMVPFGESLIPALQQAAAVVVSFLLNLTGFETARDGLILSTAAGRFEMAESCAGLRFLLAAAMIASLAAHLAFTRPAARLAFVAGALALAIAANWLRAFVIVAAATASDMRIGAGPEHVAFGWVLYAGMIVVVLLLARRYGDRGIRPSSAR
jgi:exosortase